MKTWLKMLLLEDLLHNYDMHYIHNNGRLCSIHFHEKEFGSTLKTKLSRYALPIDLRSDQSVSQAEPAQLQDITSKVNNMSNTEADSSTSIQLAATSEHTLQENLPSIDAEILKSVISNPLTPKTREIRNLRCKVSKLTKKLNKKLFTKVKLLEYLSDILNDNQYKFVLSQIRVNKGDSRGRRWSSQDKAFAYSIFQQSPSAYNILRKYLAFPCKATLRKSVGNIARKDGFCPILFKAISAKANQMTEEEKLCTLVFDEIAIKSHLSYNASLDFVDRFESPTRNDGSPQLATQALVFMIRSIHQNWKQVIAYYFRANSSPEGWFKETLINVLDKVHLCGLKVAAIVCDQGPLNRSLFRVLGISCETPYFLHNGKKIHALYDVPHLFKSVRNNLRNYDLQFLDMRSNEEKTASWKDIEDLYFRDNDRYFKMAPKLTEQHVFARGLSSMKVKLATQVFSHSVAVGLQVCGELEPASTAHNTSYFIGEMNDMFDSLNSKSQFGKNFANAVSHVSGHINQWEKWIKWIDSWRFISPKGKVVKPPCQKGLVLSLNATIGIWDEVQNYIPFLMTNRLNQDCIENTFSSVRRRGGFRDNPNTKEFRSAIRSVMVYNFMKARKSTNCEDDSDQNLIEISQNHMEPMVMLSDDEDEYVDDSVILDLPEEEITTPSPIEENVIAYISGVISNKILRKKSCVECTNLLVGPKALDRHTLFLYFKEYKDSLHGLKWPTNDYYAYVLELSNCFVNNLNTYFQQRNISKKLCAALQNISFNFFANHEQHKEAVQKNIIRSFVLMLIKHSIKIINSDNSAVPTTRKIKHFKHV